MSTNTVKRVRALGEACCRSTFRPNLDKVNLNRERGYAREFVRSTTNLEDGANLKPGIERFTSDGDT